MIKVHDDFFDKRWLDEISDSLLEAPWYANNIANADTWPYRKKGSHRLLGDCFFHRQTDNFIRYNSTDIELGSALINSFEQIQYKIKRRILMRKGRFLIFLCFYNNMCIHVMYYNI